MNIRKITKTNGLTLLEVLISMLIISIALLMLLNMAMVAVDSNDWSNSTTMATQALQHKLEELRAMPVPESGTDTTNGIDLYWNVTPVSSHLRRVDVTATWTDLKSLQKYTTVTAYIKTDSV